MRPRRKRTDPAALIDWAVGAPARRLERLRRVEGRAEVDSDLNAHAVVSFLHEEAVHRTEEAFGVTVPIISATADTLRDRLENLVADPAERHRVGLTSRAYVERVHDIERIADRLLDVYSRL